MLKLGIEPKTFALLARRSNQLSYSSTRSSRLHSSLKWKVIHFFGVGSNTSFRFHLQQTISEFRSYPT